MSKRLTNKFWYSEHYLPDHKIDASRFDCYDKLGQLEDIEEENGFDLITLFKALKDGFYIKYNDKIVHIFPYKHITINFWYKTINVFIPPKFFIDCKKGTDYLSETIDEEYWFKDYGKTWALTREELEDGKSKEDRK